MFDICRNWLKLYVAESLGQIAIYWWKAELQKNSFGQVNLEVLGVVQVEIIKGGGGNILNG